MKSSLDFSKSSDNLSQSNEEDSPSKQLYVKKLEEKIKMMEAEIGFLRKENFEY